MIRTLTANEIATGEFTHLLWLATEADDAKLGRITREELPGLTILGVVTDDRVAAFVAVDTGTDPLTIEYIAVDEGARGRGYGGALIAAVREMAAGRALYAETDDDAVGFYRRIGFAITARDSDPRWPDRERYACTLA